MGTHMNVQPTPIPGVCVIETTPFTDARGAFARLYCVQELSTLIGQRQIVQINHSRTVTVGTVRGLHFQHHPHAEMKLVRCLKGRVWDVAVDVRKGSPTYLHWHAVELTPVNARMMLIPEGFAHGFQVLEPDSELLYLHTAAYTPEAECGLRYNDPRLAIPWPLSATGLSERDNSYPFIDTSFQGLAP